MGNIECFIHVNVHLATSRQWLHYDVTKWNIFRVTGPLCGVITGDPLYGGLMLNFDLCLIKRSSKQSRRRWLETPSRSLWRQCNGSYEMFYWFLQYLVNSVSRSLTVNCVTFLIVFSVTPRLTSTKHIAMGRSVAGTHSDFSVMIGIMMNTRLFIARLATEIDERKSVCETNNAISISVEMADGLWIILRWIILNILEIAT